MTSLGPGVGSLPVALATRAGAVIFPRWAGPIGRGHWHRFLWQQRDQRWGGPAQRGAAAGQPHAQRRGRPGVGVGGEAGRGGADGADHPGGGVRAAHGAGGRHAGGPAAGGGRGPAARGAGLLAGGAAEPPAGGRGRVLRGGVQVAGLRPPAAAGAAGLPLHPPGPGQAEQVAGDHDDGDEPRGPGAELGLPGPGGRDRRGPQRLLLQSRHLHPEPDSRGDGARLRHPELLFPLQPGRRQPLSTEADPVPAGAGQHPLPAAGPGAGGCAPVPFRAETPAVPGGDLERDGGKLPPVGGATALPRLAQGLQRRPAGPVRRRPRGPALPAALLPPVRRGPGHRPLQPAPRLGPVPTQESKRFVQWQSSI
ncbi:protein tweety homolog 1 isoform X3 [Pipistrellus kuhlii]|uniref:protein tweety homolog 1 isoform X3 n=1 Tax=Pipistrellus kuhlii TaxID=59472 RepID=UPI001E273CE2|nr:protein tweety homolog 1 isoform X3 [Pipistrellus kuhlii]